MNFEGKEELDRILEIDPQALSESEVSLLRARQDYLSKEQTEIYASVLADKPTKIERADKPAKE